MNDILRQFLLAQSSTGRVGNSLLPSKIDESGAATGKHVFGTAVAVISWRTLEIYCSKPSTSDEEVAIEQTRRLVNRLVSSAADALELPSAFTEVAPKELEGYLGWAGLCLAAASLCIRISPDDCRKGLNLAQELDSAIDSTHSSSETSEVYQRIINRKGLFTYQTALSVARAAARTHHLYKQVISHEQSRRMTRVGQ